MSGLFYLTHREFSLQPSASQGASNEQKQYDLTHSLPGISIVFFYSKSCEHCTTLKPIFSSLAGKINGISFALANVSADNMQIRKMSEASKTPIKYVPLLAVYVNGIYYTEYRGPKTVESMARAIYEISEKIRTGSEFTSGKSCNAPSGASAYCAEGNDDSADVCYLTFDEAYSGKSVSNSGKGTSVTYSEAYGRI